MRKDAHGRIVRGLAEVAENGTGAFTAATCIETLCGPLYSRTVGIGRSRTGTSIIPHIAECLDVDAATLLNAVQADEAPKVIVVDDERIALSGAIPVLEKAIPEAAVTGFLRPSDALAYARENTVAIAFLDIEMGRTSGIDLCSELLELSPRTNVVFLTAYRDYSFDAWDTGACGFLLKPITTDAVHKQLGKLRYPVAGLISSPSLASRD